MALVALGACGSDPLANLGGRTRSFLDLAEEPDAPEPAAASPSTLPPPIEELHGLEGIQWYRQDDPIWGPNGLDTLEPEQVLEVIWAQSSRRDSFVQSSPAEIAAGLPEIEFPSLIPGEVGFVSSQLLFSIETGDLAQDFQAAFGLWSVFPYTQSRESGQRGALWVGSATSGVVYVDSADGELACPDLGIEGARSCRVTPIGTLVGWWYEIPDGGRLVWFDGLYRYELFLRSALDDQMAVRMAESMQRLSELAP